LPALRKPACHSEPQGQPISRLVRTAVALGSTQFAIADFDGDRQPDLAYVRVASDGSPASQYSVDFNFSGGHKPAIYVAGPSVGPSKLRRGM